MKSLDAIFSPESVAIIGASNTPGKVGHDIFDNILRGGFKGTLYPVNPKAKSILSVKTFPTINDIVDNVDLSIIILPPRPCLEAVKESIKKGVKGIVIVSAGFREVGGEGLEIENEIVSLCRAANVRLVGPNCLGVINPVPDVSLNASFSKRMPACGNISFISQSGALCAAVLDFAADRDFGFSKFISIGNKADVDELDLLLYLHEDLNTAVIILYLEELRKGPEFIEAVKKITSGHRPTPVLIIKSGRTSAGAQAAASHTGALAGTEAVYDAIFKQAGIIRADSIAELFDFANAFAYKHESALGKAKRKIPSGKRVAIVTNAGGPGILATDMTISSDLELAKFSQETIDELASCLPSMANIHNPVDVIGDAPSDRYEKALSAVIRDDGVDGALVILTPPVHDGRPGDGRGRGPCRPPFRQADPLLLHGCGRRLPRGEIPPGTRLSRLQVSRGRGQGPGCPLQVSAVEGAPAAARGRLHLVLRHGHADDSRQRHVDGDSTSPSGSRDRCRCWPRRRVRSAPVTSTIVLEPETSGRVSAGLVEAFNAMVGELANRSPRPRAFGDRTPAAAPGGRGEATLYRDDSPAHHHRRGVPSMRPERSTTINKRGGPAPGTVRRWRRPSGGRPPLASGPDAAAPVGRGGEGRAAGPARAGNLTRSRRP